MSEKPDIDQNKMDVAIAIGKGALSYLPYAGSILAELVGAIIPNQRIDRLTQFAKILDEKLGELDKGMLEQKMRTKEFVDLFEDGAFQAARALSDERREHIASLLKNSLSSDELDHIQEKQLLALLGELNDAELVILKYYGLELDPQEANLFFERHEGTTQGPLVVLGSPQDDADRGAVHETYRNRLRRLGLIRATYKKPKKGELPEWDIKTGMIKAQSDRITSLGRLLLRYIDAEVTPH